MTIRASKAVGLAVFATAVAAVPAVGTYLRMHAPGAGPAPAAATAATDLRGVWSMYPRGTLGEPIRFYYFHGDGHGLYRYGRVGLNNTHSFEYRVDDQTIALRFRKTGETHELGYRVEPDARDRERQWLVLDADPREQGTARYFRDGGPAEVTDGGSGPTADPGGPGGRMWIDAKRFATGGMAFSLYQLRTPGIDGRGHGWFHRGDFDEWSTEALEYSLADDRMSLHFTLRDERVTTPFRVRAQGERRLLDVGVDPRDFWHHHTYVDIGPSFAASDRLPDRLDRGLRIGWIAESAGSRAGFVQVGMHPTLDPVPAAR